MKKFSLLFMSILFGLMIGFVSCSKCNNANDNQEKLDTVPSVADMIFENVISTDRQYVYNNVGVDYVWYESKIIVDAPFDTDECDGDIEKITNIFQSVKEGEQPIVYFLSHTLDGSESISQPGLWIEDCSLNDEEIVLTFEQAFDKFMESNYPKPHSQFCVLRNPVGPQHCNAQYIFGGVYNCIFVDAVTGDVTNWNPAFPRIEE